MSEKEIFQKLKTIVVDQLGVNEEYYAVEQKAALQSRLQTLKIRLSLMIW